MARMATQEKARTAKAGSKAIGSELKIVKIPGTKPMRKKFRLFAEKKIEDGGDDCID